MSVQFTKELLITNVKAVPNHNLYITGQHTVEHYDVEIVGLKSWKFRYGH